MTQKDQDYEKVCPRCGSTNIGFETDGIRLRDFCKSCGLGKIGSAPDPKVLMIGSEFPMVKREQKKK